MEQDRIGFRGRKGDPTPEEIAEHCRRIRQGWTALERVFRKTGFRREDLLRRLWSVPEVSLLIPEELID